jgi:hypothetical protein
MAKRAASLILRDREAKDILEKKWPGRTNAWPTPSSGGYWIRACPSIAPQPYIHPAGASSLHTHPDGMYLLADIPANYVDVIVIEVCRTNQNFNDKRSRYTPTSGNVNVTLPLDWLNEDITIQKGRTQIYWQASGWFTNAPTSDVRLTIRHLKALFVLTDKDYIAFGTSHVPAGHEYFCRHRELAQITQQGMQDFIKGMALMRHFKSQP